MTDDKDDNDDTAVSGPAAPRKKKTTQRGHEPAVSGQLRLPPLEDGLDSTATTIDPPTFEDLPVGMPTPTPGFDPNARIDDNRRTAKIDREGVTAVRAPSPPVEAERELRVHVDDIHRKAQRAGRTATPPEGADLLRVDPRVRVEAGDIDDHLRTIPRGQAPQVEPMRAISMKTPESIAQEKGARRMPEVRLQPAPSRAQAPPQPVGRLAPPRDPREVRSRRVRDAIVWASLAVILASIVTLVIWLIAGR